MLRSSVPDNDAQDRQLGISVLLTVPLAWGSFEPAVRYVYDLDPPIPPLLFSFGYYLVAATSLAALSLATIPEDPRENPEAGKQMSLSIRGGLELGTYLFVGDGLQVLGLKTVASDRAAFLLQLTTVFVPLVQGLINGDLRSIQRKTWAACGIALLGVLVICLDGKEGPVLENLANALSNASQGDFYIIAAALAYTFHCIRLEGFAKESPAVQLAACKATVESTWTAVLLGIVFAISSSGGNVFAQATANTITSYLQSDLLSNPSLPFTVLAIIWTGLVPVAYTICAQSFGQARVSPTDANLIYTFQPICTAVIAWAVLGEALGPAGYAGGALIGSAVYMVAVDVSTASSSETASH